MNGFCIIITFFRLDTRHTFNLMINVEFLIETIIIWHLLCFLAIVWRNDFLLFLNQWFEDLISLNWIRSPQGIYLNPIKRIQITFIKSKLSCWKFLIWLLNCQVFQMISVHLALLRKITFDFVFFDKFLKILIASFLEAHLLVRG